MKILVIKVITITIDTNSITGNEFGEFIEKFIVEEESMTFTS